MHRNEDLQRLRDEGYNIALVDGFLVVSDVPFVTTASTVSRGRLVVPLNMAGNVTAEPTQHTAYWAGGMPCDTSGRRVSDISALARECVAGGMRVDYVLCHQLNGREFRDYHEFVTSYVNAMGRHAVLLQAGITARTGGGVIPDHNPQSPFHYIDTATSLAGIETLTRRLEGQSIGIVGLGGTGSYVLDLVAKTPVSAIHLFDDDTFDQHNAFRAPGAAGMEDLVARRAKVDHFAAIYSRLHRGIIPHPQKLTGGNLRLLDRLHFVFLCVDDAKGRLAIAERLGRTATPFIDTGLGLEVSADGIVGHARVTTSTAQTRAAARATLPGSDTEDAYRTNVQVADLNALNAALAVVRWKRMYGFYRDGAPAEHQSVFDVGGNRLFRAGQT